MGFFRINIKVLMLAIFSALITMPVHAVEFGAFADAKYEDSDETGATNNFAIGGLDLYATQQIDDKTKAFIEYVFENDGSGFVLDLERLWVKRKINDAFSVGAGRFHAPLGFWSRNYHHGVMIQDTVSRPFFLDFEDGAAGILPMHIIGLLFEGDIGNGLSYELSYANSSSIDSTGSLNASGPGTGVEIGIANVGDANFTDDKSVIGRLTWTSGDMPLSVSGFFMQNSVVEAAATGDVNFGTMAQGKELVAMQVMGLDLRYARGNFDLLSEYYAIENDSKVTSLTKDATAYYVQLGYRINDQFKVVYRNASLDFEANDTYFVLLNTAEAVHHTVALRYDLDDTNALTLEFDKTDFEAAGAKDVTVTTLDWSFLMF